MANKTTNKNSIEKTAEEQRLGGIIIKTVSVAIMLAFLFFVYRGADAKDVPTGDIEAAFQKSTGIDKMQKCSPKQLKQFLGLTEDDFDGVIYYKSKEALGVEEVLVIKAKKQGDIPPVRDAIDRRIDSQEKVFESYGPEQVKLMKNAVITVKGKYVFYCVDKRADKYEEVFRNAVQ